MEVKKFVDSVKTYLTSSHVQRRSFRELQKEADEYSISDIFGYWNEHLVWSFLDFALLEHIVKRMGSNTLKGLMKNYSNKMKEFRKRTKAHTLIKVWPNPVSDMCNYKQCKEILVKLKVNSVLWRSRQVRSNS